MQIAIVAVGSRGDVQPYVALGKGLHGAGHPVRVVTHPPFEGLVRGEGLDFASVGGDPRALVEALFPRIDASGKERRPQGIYEALTQEMPEMAEKCWYASQDASLLLLSTFGALFGLPIAQKLHIPACIGCMQPLIPTEEFPPTSVFPPAPAWLAAVRPYYNLLAWKCVDWGFWKLGKKPAEKAQQVLDLPVQPPREIMHQLGTPVLCGYSPSFLPQPKDWPANCHVTGYWSLETPKEWHPPAPLLDFLGAGPAPVYIGFGSMPGRAPEEMTALAIEALERTRQRGVLLAGGGAISMDRVPDHVFVLDSIPHDWLFPRVAVVVHHGGAGTTGAGLRAGKPTVIIPFITDQPFWGNQVYERGLGPKPISHKRLTAETLAEAIRRAATDTAMRARAEALGEKIRSEDGVGRATDLVCQYMTGSG